MNHGGQVRRVSAVSRPWRSSQPTWIKVHAIAALAGVPRFATLGLPRTELDVAWTSKGGPWFVRADAPREYPAAQSTPPLYYVLAWIWARIFSEPVEVGLRSL